MRTDHSAGTPGLGEFLTELEERLRALTADDLRALLLRYAERLPASERREFAGIFTGARRTVTSQSPSGPRDADQDDPTLPSDIDAFAERVSGGAYFQDWGWDHDAEQERAWGDESWTGEMDDLFARAADLFLAGDMAAAGDAYGRLLDAFELDGEVGTFCGPAAAVDMVSADVGEAAARCLRALYETTPAADRAAAVYDRYASLHHLARSLSLHAIDGTRREELPDLDLFLPDWIDVLAERPDPVRFWDYERQRLLTEAAMWRYGADGIAELARRPGPHQSATYLDWIDALTGIDRLTDAADAAREGLALADVPAERAAGIADRLAVITLRQGDPAASLDASLQAWRAAPTRRRLLTMTTAADAAGELAGTLAAAASDLTNVPGRLAAELLLLAGRADEAAGLLAESEPLGWSRPGHPGAIVLPYLLVAAARQPVPAMTTHLGRQFAAIDTAGLRDEILYPGGPWNNDPEGSGLAGGKNGGTAAPPVSLSALLAQRLPANVTPDQRERWLATARATVQQRVDAVVTAKHRGAYARVAELAAAYAETLAMCQDPAASEAFITAIRARYPRHVAFRSELDAATRSSSLLPG